MWERCAWSIQGIHGTPGWSWRRQRPCIWGHEGSRVALAPNLSHGLACSRLHHVAFWPDFGSLTVDSL